VASAAPAAPAAPDAMVAAVAMRRVGGGAWLARADRHATSGWQHAGEVLGEGCHSVR
jgi:hypothetical protein